MVYKELKTMCLGLILYSMIAVPVSNAADLSGTAPTEALLSNTLANEPGWNELEKTDGVINYTKRIDGTTFTAYKGVCVIDCPIELLFAILHNVPEHSKWISYCATSKEIERPSYNRSFQYYDFDVPWPLSDRDIVVQCTTQANWSDGTIIIKGEAVKEPMVPLKKSHMRITDSRQQWILEQISPDQTLVTFVSYTTMDGPVPGMLNKLVSNVIPSNSLKNLKKISTEKYLSSSARFLAETCP